MLYRWTRYSVTDMEVCVHLTWGFQRRVRYRPNLFHHEKEGGNDERRGNPEPVGLADAAAAPPEPLPDVKEVWFAGCHSDVGGGADEDVTPYSLQEISLRWMVKQVILSGCGIRFDAAALEEAHIDVPTVVHDDPAQQTVERQDVESQTSLREQDILAPIHDQLNAKPLWWILELLPMKFEWQEADGSWKSKWRYAPPFQHRTSFHRSTLIPFLRINFGRGREIRSDPPVFHESVRQRMAAPDLKYKPKATWTTGAEQYVE